MMREMVKFLCPVVIVLIATAAFSQAVGSPFQNYGEIIPSEEATRIFESYTVLPNHRYYISGAELYPGALIGIDTAYTLDTELWKEVEMTVEKLKETVNDMTSKGLEVGEFLYGFDILDNQGKKVGIWYSILRARTSLKMLGENRVMIYTPPLNVWEKQQDRTFRPK